MDFAGFHTTLATLMVLAVAAGPSDKLEGH